MRAEPSHTDLAQAAQWYACLRDGSASAADRAAWQRWLASADAHAAAWRYVEDISRAFEPVRTLPNPRATADHLSTADQRLRTRRRVLASLGILASGGVVGVMGWQQAWLPAEVMAWGADHARPLANCGSSRWPMAACCGSTRPARSTSGSTPMSAASFWWRGIFVETAQDHRPLRVYTPDGQMRALGTRFNVQMTAAGTQLAVYQGAVEVRTFATGATRIVPTGQQTLFTAQAIALESGDAARGPGRRAASWPTTCRCACSCRNCAATAGTPGPCRLRGRFCRLRQLPLHDTDRVLQMLAATLPIRIAQPIAWWTTIEAQR
jgi:transmembrane sensor